MVLMLALVTSGLAQQATISGLVKDNEGAPIPFASIVEVESGRGGQCDGAGKFTLKIMPGTYEVKASRVGFDPQTIKGEIARNEKITLTFILVPNENTSTIELKDQNIKRDEVSMITLDPRAIKVLPNPTGDFNRLLATMPGVVSNNELSSTYSVRGGNYDENLVYVNDIEIYRPFLVRAGQQEGLSFINPDMVSQVEFSSGGWQPRFGDKMSSVLNVNYKQPTRNTGSITAGVLYQAGHFEGISKNGKLSYVAGVRRKSMQYLFQETGITQGLETQGEYLPVFVDAQGFATYNLTSKRDSARGLKTSLSVLGSFASNRYTVRPTARETDFGSIQARFRLFVAFDGQENMNYDTWQFGTKLSHMFSTKAKSDFTFSGVSTSERERIDVEGGYRLCDVQTDPNRDNFNQCIFERGVGTEYNYARNSLDATIYNFLNRNYYDLDSNNRIEYGVGGSVERLRDNLYEYKFIDSADYVELTEFRSGANALNSYRTSAYIQHSWRPNTRSTLTYGGRAAYWSLNDEWIFSPRAQYSYKPAWETDIVFKAAAGVYQQQAFYRELRDFEGNLNTDLKAQVSYHFIASSDLSFKMWDRPFRFISEVYYKQLENVVAYDVDNVRLRYFANNDAKAYATGVDMRISGEFIQGAESWFSLGVMQTKEDIGGDNRGYIRRPTDQRVTLAFFFQDHLPNNPSVRAYVNTIIGTGLPFGPPNEIELRSQLRGPAYRRLDVGFSKVVGMGKGKSAISQYYDTIWLGVEVLNVLGADNVISYTWIKDIFNTQFAVPNSLSQRFVNAKCIVTF